MNSSAENRRKRAKLITKLIAECYADEKVIKSIKRHEDLTRLALKVHHILHHPEYREMDDRETLRNTIAQLLVDPNHRETVERILKVNKGRQWPEYRPLCSARRIKSPRTVVNAIFANMDKAWNYDRGRYSKNKAGIKFQKAVRDMLSKDWITNYCLLAGYVPVMKERKLGYIGKMIGETCGCRTWDRFQARKSSLKKIRREENNYRYHTMKRSLKRIEQKMIMKFHNQRMPAEYSKCQRNPKPGVWTRVFKGTSASIAKPVTLLASSNLTPSISNLNVLSEKTLSPYDLKEMSSPFLSAKNAHNVAIKVFSMTPNLPLKMLPARVLTFMELTTVLGHPNIIRFIESFATNRDIFIVMPYASNRSLHHIINEHGRLMQETAQVWTFHIAMAVQYLHAGGIIHRNIKCSNILITHNYEAVLSGFGSAKIKWLNLLHLQEVSSTNYHAGCRPYRAPEVLRRLPYSLPPVDLWSLGVVLFRMLNNCFPYCYHNKELMSRQQRARRWRKNWRRDSPVAKQCYNLLTKMLEPNPAKRIKIDGVVNHRWFEELPIPKSHRKAVRNAAFLFLPREPPTKRTGDQQALTKESSPKEIIPNLDDLYGLLENMTKPSDDRKLQSLESHSVYKECYTKHKLQRGVLLKNIDDALRKKVPKIERFPSPLEYEPFLSNQETIELQEQAEAGIQELKIRPEQARKFLQAPEVDLGMKMSLKEVVKFVREKAEKLQLKEDELTKKINLFTPRRSGSEPRSILTTKLTKAGGNQLSSQSTGSILSHTHDKDVIPHSSLNVPPVQPSTSNEPQGILPTGVYPMLDFTKVTSAASYNMAEVKKEEVAKGSHEFELIEESATEEQYTSHYEDDNIDNESNEEDYFDGFEEHLNTDKYSEY